MGVRGDVVIPSFTFASDEGGGGLLRKLKVLLMVIAVDFMNRLFNVRLIRLNGAFIVSYTQPFKQKMCQHTPQRMPWMHSTGNVLIPMHHSYQMLSTRKRCAHCV